MAIATSFTRTIATSASKNFPLVAAIAEHDDKFKVDLTSVVTQDDTDEVTKTVARVVIDPQIVGENLVINTTTYTFLGSATDYSSGGNTPALTVATASQTINLNTFLTAAGDAA